MFVADKIWKTNLVLRKIQKVTEVQWSYKFSKKLDVTRIHVSLV